MDQSNSNQLTKPYKLLRTSILTKELGGLKILHREISEKAVVVSSIFQSEEQKRNVAHFFQIVPLSNFEMNYRQRTQ